MRMYLLNFSGEAKCIESSDINKLGQFYAFGSFAIYFYTHVMCIIFGFAVAWLKKLTMYHQADRLSLPYMVTIHSILPSS